MRTKKGTPKKRIYNNDKRCFVYDGTERVGHCRISYNLDLWNGECNCNPEIHKHRGVTQLKDGRYAIIYTNDLLKRNVGRVVSDEAALLEIVKAKKYDLFRYDRFKRLREQYENTKDRYIDIDKENENIEDKKDLELIIVTNDRLVTGVYSTLPHLKVTISPDIPKGFYKIEVKGDDYAYL